MESATVKEDSPPLVEHNTSGTNVAAVSIKLPPFWPSDPHVWFAQVEAQFATRHITQQRTMFDYVVSSLQPEVVTEVRDLLLAPPENTPYDALKSQLIKSSFGTTAPSTTLPRGGTRGQEVIAIPQTSPTTSGRRCPWIRPKIFTGVIPAAPAIQCPYGPRIEQR